MVFFSRRPFFFSLSLPLFFFPPVALTWWCGFGVWWLSRPVARLRGGRCGVSLCWSVFWDVTRYQTDGALFSSPFFFFLWRRECSVMQGAREIRRRRKSRRGSRWEAHRGGLLHSMWVGFLWLVVGTSWEMAGSGLPSVHLSLIQNPVFLAFISAMLSWRGSPPPRQMELGLGLVGFGSGQVARQVGLELGGLDWLRIAVETSKPAVG
ncbi:hypothetical protein LZ30DRAFT_253886 [Colletotrichum cereale]|nr:hypothetical protein LZ30DRAFT_253886 [Colletotrichum cereale]